jgi:Nucleotidyl transferase AbiEii toxin, Type IV TA system
MSPAARDPYATPQALERALTDLLRADARRRPGVQVDSLRRQFAYDRLLTRVFTSPDANRWVLKGATAMLARLSGDARHTRDIDLYRQGDDLAAAEAALRVAAATDVGDFFRFTLNPGQRVTQSRQTLRVPAVAYLGLREFSRFHIDLVTSLVMTGEPDEVLPLVPVLIAGVASTTYRAHPVADHIADKVCAMIETHDRSDGQPQASTRYRDLADLATFARTAVVEAHLLIRALRGEASRRALTLPDKLTAPDAAWGPGYARVARENPRLADRDLPQALATAAAFIDPILDGTAAGTWDPTARVWSRAARPTRLGAGIRHRRP